MYRMVYVPPRKHKKKRNRSLGGGSLRPAKKERATSSRESVFFKQGSSVPSELTLPNNMSCCRGGRFIPAQHQGKVVVIERRKKGREISSRMNQERGRRSASPRERPILLETEQYKEKSRRTISFRRQRDRAGNDHIVKPGLLRGGEGGGGCPRGGGSKKEKGLAKGISPSYVAVRKERKRTGQRENLLVRRKRGKWPMQGNGEAVLRGSMDMSHICAGKKGQHLPSTKKAEHLLHLRAWGGGEEGRRSE